MTLVNALRAPLPPYPSVDAEAATLGAGQPIANLNTIDHLAAVQFRHYRIPALARGEQQSIVAFRGRETAKIYDLIAKVRQAIDLLKEFGTAWVSATATSTIDIREAVPR